MRTFAYERPTHLDEAVALLAEAGSDARPLAGGTDLIIRLRDGTIRPRTVVDVKGIAELDARHRRRRRRAAHRGPDRDDRHHRGPARPARLPGPRRGGRGRRVRPDPQPGDAGGQHRQRVAGGRHAAGAARLRGEGGRRRAGRGPHDPDRRRARPVGGHDARAQASSSPPSSCRRPTGPTRRRPPPAHAPTRTRPRVGDAGLRGVRRWDHPDRLRQPRPAAVARRRRERRAGRSRRRPTRRGWRGSRPCSHDASPSPRSMRASPEYRLAMLHVLGLRAVAVATERLRATRHGTATP